MWHVWETVNVETGFTWGRPEGRRQLGISGRRWKDNITMHLQDVGS